MAVPVEIRNVTRPDHTVVCDSGHEGPDRYMVRQREAGSKKNGKVIGHIYNGKFVPSENRRMLSSDIPEYASYGGAAVANSVSKDLFQDLTEVFDLSQAVSIMVTALIRVLSPGVTDASIASEYRKSFIQIYYPDAQLSKNTIGDLVHDLGAHPSLCRAFYAKRLASVLPDSHVAVDGMLKQDNSKINDLSDFSRKGRVKGCKDISLLYAFNIETMEPVCMEVFPGNRVDSSSYKDFVKNNHLTQGVIIDDKGFPPSCIEETLKNCPDLHFLTPIRRNSKAIGELSLQDYNGVMNNSDGDVVYYKKAKMSNGMYLYSFMSLRKHANEMRGLGRHATKKGLEPHEFQDKLEKAGTVVYESDLDFPPEIAYTCYEERWLIELAFKRYKSLLKLDTTRVHDDYAVMGSEFINFLSSLISCRIFRKADNAHILEDTPFGEMLNNLNQCWRRTDDAREPVERDDSWLCSKYVDYNFMIKLGVCKALSKPAPKKRGRKPKKKAVNTDDTKSDQKSSTHSENTPVQETIQQPTSDEKDAAHDDQAEEPAETPKRKRGRPRTRPLPDPNAPKRPVGRPRKHPLPDPNAPKRPVGRPRKYPRPDPNAPKRPVGRPRKHPAQQS